uniref:Zinc finger, CCHC-type n=1 Tax=Tanacetum cinerariifolium TaxID=118510 RepID=A0A6L2LJY4_TANCI|nr:zinc finger, CCHC-type [Tanacetum cinerariifolium]
MLPSLQNLSKTKPSSVGGPTAPRTIMAAPRYVWDRRQQIFKIKLKVDGTVEKFKVRLVIQGFKEKSGIDYFDTYAPVARISTIRLLIAMASIHSLIIHQMDVKTTFLNGELEKEVYINQPLGFIMSGNENNACKLIKSLYGLKPTLKQWHQKSDEVVLSNGYLLNQADKCVHNKFDESDKGVIICLYVNDMLIFGADQVLVDLTNKFLSSRFSMKDMGEVDVILGFRIKHESNGIAISQSHYIEKVIKKFNYYDCTPDSTPMDTCEKLMPNKGPAVSQLEHFRVIGCLILVYSSYPSVLEGYTDAIWISNTEDNSSTSGWVFLLGGGAFSWASKKQTCITGSTMKYEFVALTATDKEAEWLKNLLFEIPLTPNSLLRKLGSSVQCGKLNIQRAKAHVLQIIPRMCLEPADKKDEVANFLMINLFEKVLSRSMSKEEPPM